MFLWFTEDPAGGGAQCSIHSVGGIAVENQNWDQLLRLLPANWQQQALDTGAIQRLRGFHSLGALLRTLLLHVACGYSLRETVVQARIAGLAQISDVALLNRLRQAEDWFQSLCRTLLAESGVRSGPETSSRRIRIVDGTVVREPGLTGSQWRLLYSLEWPAVRCDFLDLTQRAASAQGSGWAGYRLTTAIYCWRMPDTARWPASNT